MAASRTATYPAAVRMARLVAGLHQRPYPWTYTQIGEALGVDRRTVLRYVKALREALTDRRGKPLIHCVEHAGDQALTLTADSRPPDTIAFQVLSLYLALSVLSFLEGTVLEQGVEVLWERVCKGLSPREQAKLSNLPKKFHSIPYAVKEYADHDETLDVLVRALIFERRVRVDYAGLTGDGRVHQLDPYTLTLFRGGLYLIGYSHRARNVSTMAVERIREVTLLDEHFTYPRRYEPTGVTDGSFGIMAGAETRVELLLHSPETVAYLRSRRLHPTQRFRTRRDGRVILSMQVRGTEELRNWILGMGPWVEVLKPAALRREVAGLLQEAAARY